LLRQSAERRKRSPILWFGDLVDFGSIGKAITDGKKEVSLSFDVEMEPEDFPEGLARGGYWGKQTAKIKKASIRLTLAEDEQTKGGIAKHLQVEVFGGVIEMELPLTAREGNSIKINEDVLRAPKDQLMVSYQGDVLPLLAFYKKQSDSEGDWNWTPALNPWADQAAQYIKAMIHGNTSTTTARRIAAQIPLASAEEIKVVLPRISGPQSWKNYVSSPDACEWLARKIHTWQLAANCVIIINQIDAALSNYFQGVRYLKPLRAVAERYYRRVDLSVSEIDPEGRNLPMFLDSLSSFELREFRGWIKKHLEIDAYPAREGDQLMIMAKSKNDTKPFNVADMGFGLSQVLPIAAQLWETTKKARRATPASIVVLEQPELHLHPDFQSRLADVFAGTVNDGGGIPTPILIETHSQQIVNRLGELIENGDLSPESVTILLFESSADDSTSTSVRISEFDENGVLKNWPFGFFDPEVRNVD